MDKGPHIISLKPGGVPPVIHVSEGEFGDKIRLYFKLLDTDGTFYNFMPRQDGTPSNRIAGEFVYTRPDGESGSCTLHIYSQTVYVLQDRTMYADPNTIVIRGIPEHLTSVPGDVVCEIRAIDENAGNKSVGYTENFIVRVEPKPAIVGNTGGGGGTGGDTPGEDNNELSWTNIKRRARAGTLKSLLSLGQELDCGEKIIIENTEYPLIFHVVELTNAGAVFDLKYPALFGSVSSGIGAYDSYLSDELKGVVSKGYHPNLNNNSSWNAPDSGLDVPAYYNVCVPGVDTPAIDPDRGVTWEYYKKTSNRIKTSIIPGIAFSAWPTSSKRSDVGPWDGEYPLLINNSGYLISYNTSSPSETVGYTVCFQIDNTDGSNTDPHYTPEWSDVKRAAQNGTLKSSSLEVGQLMPELPTVGVLRCVHIEDTWAAFDFATLFKTYECRNYVSALNQTHNLILTEEERAIFTKLISQGTSVWYAHPLTQKNLGISETGAIGGYNEILGGILLDAYSAKTRESRKKTNRSGTPVEWWAYSTGSWDWNTLVGYWFDANGDIQSQNINTNNNPVKYVNGLLVVGNLQ